MAKCMICNKGVTFGNNVSHSNRKTSRTWKPNIRKVKAVVNGENGFFRPNLHNGGNPFPCKEGGFRL